MIRYIEYNFFKKEIIVLNILLDFQINNISVSLSLAPALTSDIISGSCASPVDSMIPSINPLLLLAGKFGLSTRFMQLSAAKSTRFNLSNPSYRNAEYPVGVGGVSELGEEEDVGVVVGVVVGGASQNIDTSTRLSRECMPQVRPIPKAEMIVICNYVIMM